MNKTPVAMWVRYDDGSLEYVKYDQQPTSEGRIMQWLDNIALTVGNAIYQKIRMKRRLKQS